MPAIKGKPSDYRHAPRFEDGGPGEPKTVAIALEEPRSSEPLRMIASETRMDAAELLEPIDAYSVCGLDGASASAMKGCVAPAGVPRPTLVLAQVTPPSVDFATNACKALVTPAM